MSDLFAVALTLSQSAAVNVVAVVRGSNSLLQEVEWHRIHFKTNEREKWWLQTFLTSYFPRLLKAMAVADSGFPRQGCQPLSLVQNLLLPPTNEVWGKIMFYTCLPFCSQTPPGQTPYLADTQPGQTHPWEDNPLHGQTPPPGSHPHPRRQLKWAVRILLECILAGGGGWWARQ